MKNIQSVIGILSIIILALSILLDYRIGVIISLIGLFIALIIRQIRLQKYAYMLGHPDRHYDKYGDDDSIDLLAEAETYEEDFKNESTNK